MNKKSSLTEAENLNDSIFTWRSYNPRHFKSPIYFYELKYKVNSSLTNRGVQSVKLVVWLTRALTTRVMSVKPLEVSNEQGTLASI